MKRKTYQPTVRTETLVFLVLLIVGVLSADPKAYRRCIGKFVQNHSTNSTSSTQSLLKALHDETTCESSFPACAKLSQSSVEAVSIEPPYHAAILLLPDSKDDEFLALAGSLLVQGLQVTVYDFLRPGSDKYRVDYIQNKVLQQIPCKPDAKLKSLLNVISAVDATGKCTRQPLDPHMINRGPPMMDLLVMTMGYPTDKGPTHADTTFRADVLVMDIYNVAGLLMADKFQIPAITIGGASSLELAIDHHPDWEPPVTLEQWTDGIYLILRQRWQSLMLTNPLMTLNSKRRKVGLGPVKRPSDYFLPVVALIIQYLPQKYTSKVKNQDYWNMIHNTGAIQPLCLPCVSAYKPASGWRHSAHNPTIMVSLPPASTTLETTSAVLQSIIVGQQMLIMSKRPPFAIVWLDFGDESVSFSAQDDDFTRESSVNLLDSLARHPDTVIFVGHCDSDSLVASMLGVSVFCVSSEIEVEGTNLHLLYNETGLMDPTQIPKLYVNDFFQKHGWNTNNDDSTNNGKNDTGSGQEDLLQLDGLSQATSLIKKAAETHRRYKPWNSTEEMHNTITSELVDEKLLWRAQKKEHYDAFGILWAWIVALTTFCYVLVKTLSSPSIERYFGSHIGRFDEVFPDIEESLRMMENWYLQQAAGDRPALMTKHINILQNPALLVLQDAFHDAHATLHEVIHDSRRRLLSNPTMPCGEYSGSTGFSHVCYNLATNISVDPALPNLTPIQGCFTGNITDPASTRINGECGSLCVVESPITGADGGDYCSHCAFLESGQFVYDCTNLFPNATCPARDSHGNCVEEYEQWTCIQGTQDYEFGRGWACTMTNTRNPAFLHDEISQNDLRTDLQCSNDISGLDATACQDPVCFIGKYNNLTDGINYDLQCDYCEATQKDTINGTRLVFEYDCIEEFPDLKCPILLPNGTCRYEPLFIPTSLPENTTLWNVPSFILEGEQNGDDLEPGWTLNIDPTIFNAVMDIFDRIVMTLFAASVGMLYPVYLALQLRDGKRGVDASALGNVPSDFWSAIRSFRSWNFSVGGMLLLLLVLVADLAHSVSDFDLDFVATEQRGPNRTVLQLGAKPHQRNPFPPVEFMGDPSNLRTVFVNKYIGEGKLEASRAETSILGNFLHAVDLAARGGSPFVKRNRTSWRRVRTTYGNVDGDFISFYVDNDASPLLEMDMEIPLECYDVEMAKSTRDTAGDRAYGDEPRETTSWVPNCILTAKRSTGLYDGQRMESPRILETLEGGPVPYTDLSKYVRLTNGNESFVFFEASPESKALAIDRNETKDGVRGRRFYEIDGMEVGTISISFSNVFVASGAPLRDERQRTKYGLVAEVNGTCPSRPSGLDRGDEECLITIVLHCSTFPEDSATIVHDIYGPELESSPCELFLFNIAWGRNFKADAELAATVAGLYGMIKPTMVESTLRNFYQHGILAALFALSQVKEAPSIEQVVRPRVNVQYIVFTLLPLVASIAMFVLAIWANRHWKLPVIPTETWQFLLVGAEDEEVLPKRQDRLATFPKADNQLVFAAFLEDEDVPGSSTDSETGGDSAQGEQGSILYGIVRKNSNENLRNLTLSIRKSSVAIPLGAAQALQSNKDSSSDDGGNSTPASNGKNVNGGSDQDSLSTKKSNNVDDGAVVSLGQNDGEGDSESASVVDGAGETDTNRAKN